ncbi:hypothetical protein ILUMI_12508 [Ignelater luminosus]|uniref:Uncharacterized protein n=1 Tax=Ignelater luminosus TaxID=2038154 RepID=A0A8K0GCV6_IGNLU|nr:hypothetical protein ILUMI_12508 [Ignelater luminosus]
MIAVVIPFLKEDATVQAACSYGVNLLHALEHESDVFYTFSNFSASIRYLVEKSIGAKDETATAAIHLLKQLITNQICSQATCTSSIVISFKQLFYGNVSKVLQVLEFLRQLLMYGNQQNPLLIRFCENELLEIYHRIHIFTSIPETASESFKVLKLLLLKSDNLAFSLVTPHTLPLICKNNMKQHVLKPFLEFLVEWLKKIILISYIEIPVHILQLFMNWIPYYEENYEHAKKITRLLNSYESSSQPSSSFELKHWH